MIFSEFWRCLKVEFSDLDDTDDASIRIFYWQAEDRLVAEVAVVIHRRIEATVFVRVDDVHRLQQQQQQQQQEQQQQHR